MSSALDEDRRSILSVMPSDRCNMKSRAPVYRIAVRSAATKSFATAGGDWALDSKYSADGGHALSCF